MEIETKAVLVRIEGRVQGVGFRAWTLHEAQALGLVGWVRNEADSSVTARLEGPQESVERMLDMLRVGPPGAAVTKVSSEASIQEDMGSGFRIAR
ncbi:acylphosphatase [Mesorhizobium koreense]|uniref:acylphosphatase n=1 Tax=Mesorhizobium koreense TaxID=3074855 RepID=UPI00287B976E|nr:acylphosphatase [Mesorhizobium sp. WR6]